MEGEDGCLGDRKQGGGQMSRNKRTFEEDATEDA